MKNETARPTVRRERCASPAVPGRFLSPLAAVLPLLASLLAACGTGGSDGTPSSPVPDYVRQDTMIPMRDGVRLHTEIYRPRNPGAELPILLNRTPYGQYHDGDGLHAFLGTRYRELAESGYVFVFQDIRGRYGSEGEFVMLRPPCGEEVARDCVDEGTDAYDTIEWLLEHLVGHNGRVGVLGISYPGWLTAMAMVEGHPAVRAVSPQAAPSDMFIGDDFHHNGAFRLAPGFGYVTLMERADSVTPYNYHPADAYDFFLELGPLFNVRKRLFPEGLPTWTDFVEHPNYDEFWKRQETSQYLDEVTAPVLNVAGWFDAEDFYGPMRIYRRLEALDDANRNYLVAGPWRHGGWADDAGDSLGAISFGEPTGRHFREEIQRGWFDHHLKGERNLDPPEAFVFQTGANRWQCYAEWPPAAEVEPRNLYFHPGGRLSFDPPPVPGSDAYVSDPANPVPYQRRPIPGFWQGGHALWKVEDQRFVAGRPDVLVYETAPLEEPVSVAGPIVAHLHASTTGSDSDWIVKVIDVFPEDPEPDWEFYPSEEVSLDLMDGYQLMVAAEVMRGRFRSGFDEPEPVPSDRPVQYEIDLRDRSHMFREGHRIMVQVQSTWFPLIDRNPQTFVPNIFEADSAAFRAATQRVYRSPERPSRLRLPVVSDDARTCEFRDGSQKAGDRL